MEEFGYRLDLDGLPGGLILILYDLHVYSNGYFEKFGTKYHKLHI